MSYELSKTFNDGSQNSLTTVPSYQTSYLDYITTAGTYTYSISAKNVDRISLHQIRFRYFIKPFPPPPLNLTLIAIPTSSRNIQINLTWNAPVLMVGTQFPLIKSIGRYSVNPQPLIIIDHLRVISPEILSQTGDYCYYVTAVTTLGKGHILMKWNILFQLLR